jgi:hypothetical protein
VDLTLRLIVVADDWTAKLDELLALVRAQKVTTSAMASDLDALAAQVAANTSAEQSAVLLLTQLHDLLVAAQSDPAKLQTLLDQLATSKEALSAALVANTV